MRQLMADAELERQFQCWAFLEATVRVAPLVAKHDPAAPWAQIPLALVATATVYGTAGDLVAMEAVCR